MTKFTAALMAALCLAAAAPAAAIPPGTYQRSCKDIKLKDPDGESARLQARCLDNQGEWRRTSFELDRCWGDLANIDGELVCVADQRHGGQGFRDQDGWGGGPGYPPPGPPGPPPPGAPGHQPPPMGDPKDVAVEICIERAIREAYRGGVGYARLHKIEDVDRKDAGRIKVKGVVLAAADREARKNHEMPFRCDSRHGQILEFRWR